MSVAAENTPPAGRSTSRRPGLPAAALLIAGLAAVPLLSLFVLASGDASGVWRHLAVNVLPSSLAATLELMAGVAIVTGAVGVGAAWLVSRYEFPARRILHWLLVLPLAIPTYLSAYCFVELAGFTGPLQGLIRQVFGFTRPTEYWFPEIRSVGGAIFVMGAVLYPYVYLTCRLLFEMQGRTVIEAGRVLGASGARLFFAVALPLARPAVAAGMSLALMETLNDIGAVEILGVRTLTFSVFDTWLNRSSLAGAAQIACLMLAIVALLLVVEKRSRGARSYAVRHGGAAALGRVRLSGWRAWSVTALCLVPPLIGFGAPVYVMLDYAIARTELLADPELYRAAGNSILVAAFTAATACIAALALILAVRGNRSRLAMLAVRTATLGYAIPGSVLAIGMLYAMTNFDNAVDALARAALGVSTGLVFSGSALIIIYACTVRFLAIAHGSIEAGQTRLSSHVSMVARTLGRSAGQTFVSVELPLLRRAIATAALLVFVDTMKELSATILLRPFNFPTLATHVYELASRARFEDAAMASLLIVVIGAVPVLALSRLQGAATLTGFRQ
jgi:iron(III) transport system permease protein